MAESESKLRVDNVSLYVMKVEDASCTRRKRIQFLCFDIEELQFGIEMRPQVQGQSFEFGIVLIYQ
jgi:hypothetical protein